MRSSSIDGVIAWLDGSEKSNELVGNNPGKHTEVGGFLLFEPGCCFSVSVDSCKGSQTRDKEVVDETAQLLFFCGLPWATSPVSSFFHFLMVAVETPYLAAVFRIEPPVASSARAAPFIG